jgi:hypothetical protein
VTSSLPPHLLRAPGSRPGDPRRGTGDEPVQLTERPHVRAPQRLQVTAGEPGTYDPDLSPADRPVNMTVLRAAARPATDDPWPAGAYVLVGTSGKRAHWTGEEWHSGASPGYAAPVDRSEPEQSQDADQQEQSGNRSEPEQSARPEGKRR